MMYKSPALAAGVARPVDLSAARVCDHQRVTGQLGGHRVVGAHPMHRDAKGLAESGRGGHAHAQTGKRPGPAADHNGA